MATQVTTPISFEEFVLYCLKTDYSFFCHAIPMPQAVQLLDEELCLRRDSYDAQSLARDTHTVMSKLTEFVANTEDIYATWPELRLQRELLVQAATKVLIVSTNASMPVYMLFLYTALVISSCSSELGLAFYTVVDLYCFLRSIKTWSDDWESLHDAINPPEYFQLKFHHNARNARRLDGLVTHKKTYKRVSSHYLTWRSYFGCIYLRKVKGYEVRSSSDLRVSISVSKSLAASPHDVKDAGVIIDIGGGGMTTGSPWDPAWKSQALIDLIETRPIVYITFDRRRLPECNGEDILNDIHDAMAYLFDQDGIETLVKAHYPSLGWCRHKLVLTGESAGGFLGLHIYLEWGQRISGVYLRYPLLHEYRRDFGPYMEREVVFKKAAISLFRLFSLLNVLYDLPPAVGRFPSDGMWPAYKTSCFKVWGRLWNASYPIDLLREKSLNTTTEFLVLHGTSDVRVPIASPRSFVRSMQERGIRIVLKEVSSAAHGFDYDISLLNPNMESLGQMMDRLGM